MRTGRALCNLRLAGFGALIGGSLIVAMLVPRDAAAQSRQQVLYSFCSQPDCTDGGNPVGGLIMDAAGNFYGTTENGGTSNSAVCHAEYSTSGCGTVFQLSPDPSGTGWTETVLYSFCLQPGCADGAYPSSGLIADAAGNLYGTTRYGGGIGCNGYGCGTVFKLSLNPADPSGTGWSETVLYSFCSNTNCADGSRPQASLGMDPAGNLYGTTPQGGIGGGYFAGYGVVFELIPDPTGTVWTQTVLYSFCSLANCADGATPNGVIIDTGGNLYGTTSSGGLVSASHYDGSGVVFKLSTDATGTGWTEAVLYSFCSQSRCADGAWPVEGVIADTAGNLYGATSDGGTLGRGAVFKMALDPSGTGWTETLLYSFCAQTYCEPGSGVSIDAAGNLYGTTSVDRMGSVFELTPDPTGTAWTPTVLCEFHYGSCPVGRYPNGGLIADAAGTVYGTAGYGGISSIHFPFGSGVVFKLTP